MLRRFCLALVLGLLGTLSIRAEEPTPIKILFLGDDGHHKPPTASANCSRSSRSAAST